MTIIYIYIPFRFLELLSLRFLSHFSIFFKVSWTSVYFLLNLQISIELRIILWLFPLKFIFTLNVWLIFIINQSTKKVSLLSSLLTKKTKVSFFYSWVVPLKARIYFGLNMEGFLKWILLISTISGVLCEGNYSGSNKIMVIKFISLK